MAIHRADGEYPADACAVSQAAKAQRKLLQTGEPAYACGSAFVTCDPCTLITSRSSLLTLQSRVMSQPGRAQGRALGRWGFH